MEKKEYYLGLDIGTDSVGYAVTTPDYKLMKFHGEPMWGSHLFDAAVEDGGAQGKGPNAKRRAFRTARRRLNRRQQRVQLVQEIFAKEIASIDPEFYHRIRNAGLYAGENDRPLPLFVGPYTDRDYHRQYPTIHHLICDLMNSDEPHDVRLVYLACAWLVAHRGHFLSDVTKENASKVLDVTTAYNDLMDFLKANATETVWQDVAPGELLKVMNRSYGIKDKTKHLRSLLTGVEKAIKADPEQKESFPYSREHLIVLLSGGTCQAKDLYMEESYAELPGLCLDADDEKLLEYAGYLGDDAELLYKLKAVYDCAMLNRLLTFGAEAGKPNATISETKVRMYEQHSADLKELKALARKYLGKAGYREMFRTTNDKLNNYTAYSKNAKASGKKPKKCSSPDDFYKYVQGAFEGIVFGEADAVVWESINNRIKLDTYMPKQVNTDNRLIPYQLFYAELDAVLKKASCYLPFLDVKDADGLTPAEKLRSIMTYRIPYFVGPLNKKAPGSFGWIERKAEGPIRPWNFEDLVDLDASEKAFIDRMIGTCTYCPGEKVLPKNALMYERFVVLNEINTISVNGVRIDSETKQRIYNDLFVQRNKVTAKAIKNWLVCNGICNKAEAETLAGIDTEGPGIKSALNSRRGFAALLAAGKLTEAEAERIIEQAACTEDKGRFSRWLERNYPKLSEEDRRQVKAVRCKDFGRLSARFLTGIPVMDKHTGEVNSVLGWMWEQNLNLMELRSDRFDLEDTLKAESAEYYAAHPLTLRERLNEMYVSNAVKRPIIRTLDIMKDVVKANGCAPAKVFIEMARGPQEKGKRTKSRLENLRELYKKVKDEDARVLEKELEAMGIHADNRLQSDKLYLYYLQMGRCMYTGEHISLQDLSSLYDRDHIYPQAKVKDDSLLNNLVLVKKSENGRKSDEYPLSGEIRSKMKGHWEYLKSVGLLTQEKYLRLTRSTPFTQEEAWGFVNRQITETRQSTKAVATLLKERYPDTQIVYVRAGLVSEFRQEFGLLKSRRVNDLHHAKDAYLNIVAGNVYHERFTENWFRLNWGSGYSIKVRTLYGNDQTNEGKVIWKSNEHLDLVKATVAKNNAHLTNYAYIKKGQLFEQTIEPAKKGLIPLKKNKPTERYGGYNSAAFTFFVLAKYTVGKKTELCLVYVDLLNAEIFAKGPAEAENCIRHALESNIVKKRIGNLSFPIGLRPIKKNTVFELDGFKVCLTSKDSKGERVGWKVLTPLSLDYDTEKYIKHLESFVDKCRANKNLQYDAHYDKVTKEQNSLVLDLLKMKAIEGIYSLRPEMPKADFEVCADAFSQLDIKAQCACLLQILTYFSGNAQKPSGIKLGEGKCRLSSRLKNWTYKDVRIVDVSASGLFQSRSMNLMDLLK